MNPLCKIGNHKWSCCVCLRCGLQRDSNHLWNGCTCKICRKVRDEGHQWNGCKCAVCGRVRDEGHQWDQCICRICGRTRNEGHDWDGCICRRCKTARNGNHTGDLAAAMARMRPVCGGKALSPKEKLFITCSRCGRWLRPLEKEHKYCPKCLQEVQVNCVDWGGTSMKYEVVCAHCGYKESYSVCDSY